MMHTNRETTGWVGWIYFASMMLLIVGGLQIVAGLVALLNSGFYLVSQDGLVVWNYTTWGWIHLAVGALLIITALAVMSGRTWARVLASVVVVLNAITNLAFLSAYPLWSLIALIIDGFILYALTVHGREMRDEY